MRCPDCNKFVSYDEGQVEIESSESALEVNAPTPVQKGAVYTAEVTMSVNASLRLVLPCGECGAELKEASFELEGSNVHVCKKIPVNEDKRNKLLENFEAEAGDGSPTDRLGNKDSRGKPITKMRYMKHYYGAEIEFTGKCPFCEAYMAVQLSDEIQASSMDEII